MNQRERILTMGLIAFLLFSIITIATLIYYYQGYVSLEKQYNDVNAKLGDVSFTIDVLLKYSNGTQKWFNQTLIPIGCSLFNATIKVTSGNIQYSTYDGTPFITAINGVKGTGSYVWIWYNWDSTSQSWNVGEIGANVYILRKYDIVSWYLVDASTYPNLPLP